MSDVRHDATAHRFTLATGPAEAGSPDAVLAYEVDGDRVVFAHTVVPDEARGQGAGTRLVEAAVAHARAQRWAVVPKCPFVAAYMAEHPEARDVLAPGVEIG